VKRVLVTLPLPAAGTDLLRQRFEVKVVEAEGMPAPELERLVRDFDPDGIVGMVNVPISDAIMEAAPRLRCIANYAVGYNNIDLEAAVRRGILVTNTPGVLTEATADLAFALLLAIARRVSESDRFLREGRFQGWKADLLLGSDVYGRTLGIIGLGRIGQAVARRARGFEMTVLYTDARRAEAGIEADLRASFVSLDDLLRQADFVTIHADLNAQTRHLGSEHYLINAARGPIVDEAALVRALREGWIKGAGLDVYEHEPRLASGLTDCPNTVLLPHLGSATVTARNGMASTAARNMIEALEGRVPPNLVNPDVLAGKR